MDVKLRGKGRVWNFIVNPQPHHKANSGRWHHGGKTRKEVLAEICERIKERRLGNGIIRPETK